MSEPGVEILYFEGCPHVADTLALVERVASQLGVEPEIRIVEVPDAEAAAHSRFLGSPTVRIDGHDVEPAAEERKDYVLSCRLYRGDRGFSGQPAEQWVLIRGGVADDVEIAMA